MSAALIPPNSFFQRLSQLRELLRLVADVRDLGDPLASVDQFRTLVGLVLRAAAMLGLDPARLERWKTLLTDDELIVAAIALVRFAIRRRGAV